MGRSPENEKRSLDVIILLHNLTSITKFHIILIQASNRRKKLHNKNQTITNFSFLSFFNMKPTITISESFAREFALKDEKKMKDSSTHSDLSYALSPLSPISEGNALNKWDTMLQEVQDRTPRGPDSTSGFRARRLKDLKLKMRALLLPALLFIVACSGGIIGVELAANNQRNAVFSRCVKMLTHLASQQCAKFSN